MKHLIFGTVFTAFLFAASAFAAAPGSVSNTIFQRVDLALGVNGGGTYTLTLLRADGTYQVISDYDYSKLTQAITYRSAVSGTYTYVVSTSDPNQAMLTTSGTQQPLTFSTGLTGTVWSTGLYTFTLFPAIADGGAVNVSNRAWVNSTRTATTGFVVGGTVSRWVLLRAVGPSLATFNVPVVVAAPQMKLFRGQANVGNYGSWSAQPALVTGLTTFSAIAGAFPLTANSADSVGLVLLAPGAYTFQCGGATTDAEVLMEAYVLPYGG